MQTPGTTIDLAIEGMTCASCAQRVEKQLNRIDGVAATVNYATEKATVAYPVSVRPVDLLSAVEVAGYHAVLPPAAGSAPGPSAAPRDLLRIRLLVSAVLTVPIVVLTMVPGIEVPYAGWLALGLAAPVVGFGGWSFHRAAVRNARHGAATMDTLISLGTLVAYGWSLYAVLAPRSGGSGHPELYVEVAAVVTTVLLLGRFFEARARRRAGDALRSLFDLGAKDVTLVDAGVERQVPVEELVVGSVFVVRAGEKVATDGVVVDGRSAVDVSLLTGESVPVEVGPDDAVVGATVNVGGRLVVRATRVGADTQLAQMARLVEQAQTHKSATQRLADRISGVFVPVVLVVAALTLLGWLVAGQPVDAAVTAAVAVLIIACPCALGLATPTALMVGTGRGAQLGILVRGPEALESARAVDVVLLDKTGTVTEGAMAVVDVVAAAGTDGESVLARAAAVEQGSTHPIARAVRERAASDGLSVAAAADFHDEAGSGVSGRVDGVAVRVGRREAFGSERALDPVLQQAVEQADARGRTAILVGWDGAVQGVIAVADRVRVDAPEAVDRLRQLGLEVVLLTGDRRAVAIPVAATLGIPADHVVADVLPAGKVAEVHRWQQRGHTVAMVGDGVNDAAALAQADLGIALGAGADVAIEAADLTLVRTSPLAVVDAIALARRTLGVFRGNLFWAFAYNVAAIPLAAAGLLSPMIAGAAMALSSIFVVANSLRLRTFRPQPH